MNKRMYLCFMCGAHYGIECFTNYKAGLTNWCDKCKKADTYN